MKQSKIHAPVVALIALVTSIAGCGGGGDDAAGAPTALNIIPATVTFTAPTGTPKGVCLSGGSQTVFIYGGAAPYRIDNTLPTALSVDQSQVSDRGGSFTVTVTGGCMTSEPIVVLDKLNNTVTFTVTNSPAAS